MHMGSCRQGCPSQLTDFGSKENKLIGHGHACAQISQPTGECVPGGRHMRTTWVYSFEAPRSFYSLRFLGSEVCCEWERRGRRGKRGVWSRSTCGIRSGRWSGSLGCERDLGRPVSASKDSAAQSQDQPSEKVCYNFYLQAEKVSMAPFGG